MVEERCLFVGRREIGFALWFFLAWCRKEREEGQTDIILIFFCFSPRALFLLRVERKSNLPEFGRCAAEENSILLREACPPSGMKQI